MPTPFTSGRGACLAVTLLTLATTVAQGQRGARPDMGRDSAMATAGIDYKAGSFHRFLLGGTYRDSWTTPIRVPILNLRTFAGGLTPTEEGGGNQTKSLHFITPEGVEYAFRSVDKDHVTVPRAWKHSVMETMAKDQISGSYPAAGVMSAPMLEAAGVLHVTPILAIMPDDTLLGKFRKGFAGRLGTIELLPGNPKGAPAFAGAVEIINSEKLLERLDRDPTQQVDARALLAARLMDMMFNDWDRHPGQWKWALLTSGQGALWEPIPRDRDHAFGAFGGVIPGLAGKFTPEAAGYTGAYPSLAGMTRNSLEFDRRLLGGLEKPVWDSVALAVKLRVTDESIDAGMRAVPPEYQSLTPNIAPTIRLRRDALPEIANRFYALLASIVDIHATDAADRATITRDDRFVEVRLQSGDAAPYFRRRFDSRETRQIRLYLHGGDDSATVLGQVTHSIPVWIIGGNGTNQLLDSSTVGGHRHPAHRSEGVTMAGASAPRPRLENRRPVLADMGAAVIRADPSSRSDRAVTGVSYGADTLFNRRPLLNDFGKLVARGPDRGGRSGPIVGLSLDRDLGLLPRFGMKKTRYAFGRYPYDSRIGLEGGYAFGVNGWKLAFTADKRRENSPVHFTALVRVSQLELVNFHGLGNSTPESSTDFFSVRQRQWLLQPAIALGVARGTDLFLGPVIQYSVTDPAGAHFVTFTQPYGYGTSGSFGEAGLQIGLHRDTRTPTLPRRSPGGMVLDLTGSVFPALWDVSSAFEKISATTTWYFTFPVLMRPTLVLRGGGRKIFGDAPFQEAAFIGGNTTVRGLDVQRYAGDASVNAGAEIRLPVARFSLLLPLEVGLLATQDIGRVYVDGASPGGWHNAFGTGFFVAFHDLTLDVRVIRRIEVGRPHALTIGASVP